MTTAAGTDLAELSAGPELSAALGALPLAEVPNDRMLERLRAQVRQANHEDARIAATLVKLARTNSDVASGSVSRRAEADEWATHESRAALCWTNSRAESEHALAEFVVGRLPEVFDAWFAGAIDRPRVRLFEQYLFGLDAEQIALVCASSVPQAGDLTTGQLGALLKRLVVAIDPDAAARWYRRSVRERGVCAYLAPDGTVTITAHGLPADQAQAACDRVERLASTARREGHPGTIAQIRADVHLGLLDGRFHTLGVEQIVAVLIADHHRAAAATDSEGAQGTGARPDTLAMLKRSSAQGAANRRTSYAAAATTNPHDDPPHDGGLDDPNHVGLDVGGPGDSGSDDSGSDDSGSDDSGSDDSGSDDSGPDETDPRDGGPDGGVPPRRGPDRDGPAGCDARAESSADRYMSIGSDGGTTGTRSRDGCAQKAEPECGAGTNDRPDPCDTDHRDPGAHTGDGPGSEMTGPPAGPSDARPHAADQRRGIEIRIALSTLLGRDDHPGEIPGLGPVPAHVARACALRQIRSEWRFAVTTASGTRLLSEGHTSRRPAGASRAGAPPGGIVEIHLTEGLLAELILDPSRAGAWAAVVADIGEQHADYERHLADLDSDSRARLPGRRQRRHTEIRDRTCSFAGVCRRPAHHCDQDHRVDHAAGGPTVVANLGPVCPMDHAVKHRAGWISDSDSDGALIWHSPLGGVYPARTDFLTIPMPGPVGPAVIRPRPGSDPEPDEVLDIDGTPILDRPPRVTPTEPVRRTAIERHRSDPGPGRASRPRTRNVRRPRPVVRAGPICRSGGSEGTQDLSIPRSTYCMIPPLR